MVFDRIFGTYTPEDDAVPLRFGLVHPAGTQNSVRIVFHEFGGLLRDVLRARGWRERLGFLFRPPGWQPPTHPG